jgi:hypothetical protein
MIQLKLLSAPFQGQFWRFRGRTGKGAYNVENTLAETFNLE